MIHYTLYIYDNNLQCTVFLHSVNKRTGCEGIFAQTTCSLYKLTNRCNIAVHLIFTRTHYGTFYFYHIAITLQRTVHRDRIAVSQMERIAFKLIDGVDREFAASFAHQIYIALISITGKSTSILDERTHTFLLFHFVVHGALYLTCNIDKTLIGTDYNHVTRSQTHITLHVSIQNVIIDVAC